MENSAALDVTSSLSQLVLQISSSEKVASRAAEMLSSALTERIAARQLVDLAKSTEHTSKKEPIPFNLLLLLLLPVSPVHVPRIKILPTEDADANTLKVPLIHVKSATFEILGLKSWLYRV